MSFLDALLQVLNVLLIAGSPAFVSVYAIAALVILFIFFIASTFASGDTEFYSDFLIFWWERLIYWAVWLILVILALATLVVCVSAIKAENILYW